MSKSISIPETKEKVQRRLQGERPEFSSSMSPGRCKKCGFEYEQHAIATPDEVEFLRSLGYGVFICRDIEDTPALRAYVEIVAMNLEGEFLNTYEIEETCKNSEPNDPCNSDYMRDIST